MNHMKFYGDFLRVADSLPRAYFTRRFLSGFICDKSAVNGGFYSHNIIRSNDLSLKSRGTRWFSGGVKTVNVPPLGDSISEGTLTEWKKSVGDHVEVDGVIAIVETDKVTIDVNSPLTGVIVKQYSKEGDTIYVGNPFYDIDTSEKSTSEKPTETKIPMSRMRIRIAERLKFSQNENVMLTTFNECDMSNIMELRKELNESGKVSCKLGYVSAFIRASTLSLLKMPNMNSYIQNNEIVTKHYVDISVAVSTPTGLVVPDLVDVAKKARENKLTVKDMSGGTFTISNGGVYGSVLSTPIINPPQSSILGMHSIIKRCVVRDDTMVIRPIMNLALTYDHRLIDGREAVTFLISIRDHIENPKLLL